MKRDNDNVRVGGLDRRTFMGTTAMAVVAAGSGAFVNGPARASTVHSYTLEVGETATGLGYNGKSPGPLISASPGDRIDVHLVNNLSVDNDDCVDDHNIPHGNNTTNLHTHGLHVSPYKDSTGIYDADNVFLKVTPKGQDVSACPSTDFREGDTKFRFELPEDHPPGTHWYHAHKHGSTFYQVVRGLAGPLIIRDPAGHMPPYIERANERIFMMTNRGMKLVDPAGGGVDASVKLQPGAVERWRIINATPRGTAFVSLEIDDDRVELWQIAFDGLTLNERIRIVPENKEPWERPAGLAPGNRTDLMVHVPKNAEEGALTLDGVPGSMEHMHPGDDGGMALATEFKISIEIEGDSVDDLWSDDTALPGPGLEPIETVDSQRIACFEVDKDGNNVIDGEPYDGKVKKIMKLNTAEEWIVSNKTTGTHPFHIHVNPFFVTHINGKPAPAGLQRWQDTIALPRTEDGKDGSVTFRTRFIDFTGAFVIHCHILLHEDRGMMQKVEVVS